MFVEGAGEIKRQAAGTGSRARQANRESQRWGCG